MRSRPILLVLAMLAIGCNAVGGGVPTPTAPQAPTGGYPGWPPAATSDLIPIPVTAELVVGQNRLLINLVDQQNNSMASATRPVEVKLYNLAQDPANAKVDTQGIFLPTIEGRPGLYRASVTFDAAGDWGLETITTEADGTHRTGRMVFSVLAQGTTPAIGAQAPTSPTPTATTADGIAHISTRHLARSRLLQGLRARRARRPQAFRDRLRDAGLLSLRDLRANARHGQVGRRRLQGQADLHSRRAIRSDVHERWLAAGS